MTSTSTSKHDSFTLNLIHFISHSDLSYSEAADVAETIMYARIKYELCTYTVTCDTYEEMLHARFIADELLKIGVTTEYTVSNHEDSTGETYYIVSSALNLD